MNRARMVRSVKHLETPKGWLAIALALRTIRALGGDRRRWTARMGYALRRANRPDQAAAAYTAAIGAGCDGAGPEVNGARVSPHWYYNLGLCLRQRGDVGQAVEAFRMACRRDRPPERWLGLLAGVEEEAGNLPEAIAARRRVAERSGDSDPDARLKLASLHNEAGQWDEARRLLIENTRTHPGHAPSHTLLAEVVTAMSRWGGTFAAAPSGRTIGGFRFAVATGPHPDGEGPTAVSALERSVALAPESAARRVSLAAALAADGDLPAAIEQYEIALDAAGASDGRWALGAKRRWQFLLERSYHRLGNGRVTDPLFECEVEPAEVPASHPDDAVPVPGFFQAQLTCHGLKITGVVAGDNRSHVDLLLDGVPLRSVNVSRDRLLPGFSLHLTRRTLTCFPADATLEVRSPTGAPLRAPGGAGRLRLSVPHGDGRALEILADGGKVDKKGEISRTAEETRQRQERYLEIYSKLRDFFEKRFGRTVFLMYGTLLGYYRDGDFIPGDDDFDAGYISDETNPVAVKEEAKQLIVELVRAGFTVSVNPRGKLFRVQLTREGGAGLHIDLHPIWFQAGNAWAHNQLCRLPLDRAQFLPVAGGTLRKAPIAVPRDTEAFLRRHYGPGWKVPDPGFTYHAFEVDPAIRRNLAKALISVAECRKLSARIEREVGDSPDAGRFVSIGAQDLYPLKNLIA